MNELKISEAANTRATILSVILGKIEYCPPLERTPETLIRAELAKALQEFANSELDRIAGPLAEALAESLNELRRICKEPNWLIGVGSEVLENYRKERGE